MTNFYHLADDKNDSGRMNCWHCGTELIWGGDHSMEDINDGEESEYDFFSNLPVRSGRHMSKFIITFKWLV